MGQEMKRMILFKLNGFKIRQISLVQKKEAMFYIASSFIDIFLYNYLKLALGPPTA
jgi:hypothetical protein